MQFTNSVNWPYLPTLSRLALALAAGLFVGLERERRGKEAGVRTFGFVALLGCLGGLMGDAYALLSVALLGILLVFLNAQRLHTNQTAELTTSAALLVTGLMGVLCGKGHTFTPVTIAIVAAGLLAWKERLADFSVALTEIELRSAILLGLLTFVIYPVLPEHALDPWGLVEPRATWATVILIAALGFVNYILWKIYGTRGVELTGFLGGLVNSTVAVTELATRTSEAGESLVEVAYRGVMLATAAMILRNSVLLGIIAISTLAAVGIPLALMFLSSLGLALLRLAPAATPDPDTPTLRLESPFSLQAAFKFGLVFLALHIAGTLAQRFLGTAGFYAVSVAGGVVSSASAVASAASLAAHGQISASVAGNGAVLASLASVLINLPVVARLARQPRLTLALARALALVTVLGIAGMLLQSALRFKF